MSFVIRTYDYLRARRVLCLTVLLLLTVVLAVSLSRQHYKEDITDFLPLGNKNAQALKVFQQLSGADRIVAIVSLTDSSSGQRFQALQSVDGSGQRFKALQPLMDAVDAFTAIVQERDTTGIAETIQTEVDVEQMEEIMQFVYSYMPFLLTDSDYARMDSLLSQPDYIASQLAADKQMLLLPMSGMMAQSVAHDPLNFFAPVAATLQQRQPTTSFENYDGYIFTPDMSRAVVLMKSPYGGSETSRNAQLLEFLEDCANEVGNPDVDIHFTGGPVIAVGNARQIRSDSLLAMSLALVLIVVLLFTVFRRVSSLLLIVLSIAWGWLFAMGVLALLRDSVSLIVIGISSVIIGIAVNYPLHLIAHLRHTPSVRQALREIATPLVVGNITTVGAFLALVPLQSVALRDLGLFSSLLLIGTIIFVLIFLPQGLTPSSPSGPSSPNGPTPNPSPEGRGERRVFSFIRDHTSGIIKALLRRFSPPLGGGVGAAGAVGAAVLTLLLGYFSLGTTFDANLANINYITAQQRQDLKSLSFLYSEGLRDGFLPSLQQQEHRLALWCDFVGRHGSRIETGISEAARAEGFADGTFDPFLTLLHDETQPQPIEFFDPGTIASRLSDDFNYIGWACGLIVFLFLWFSLGSLELALLSFLPMAVSWVWILGLMSLLDIHFNVVNIILATFIFGQGDDYTIFMTEGCQYEYAYRRLMLASYKKSIILSALIMFIGIGTLIFAKHPALRSLAEVTIVGMFCVVLMAWLLPSLIFRWLVADSHGYRRRPLSLALLWHRLRGEKPGTEAYYRHLVYDRYRYKGLAITRAVGHSLRHHPSPSTSNYPPSTLHLQPSPLVIANSGWGEQALLLALQHPSLTIIAIEADEEKRLVASHSAEGIAPNLTFQEKAPETP